MSDSVPLDGSEVDVGDPAVRRGPPLRHGPPATQARWRDVPPARSLPQRGSMPTQPRTPIRGPPPQSHAPPVSRGPPPRDSVRAYQPGVEDTGVWVVGEGARTPMRFRERVIAQFRSPQNVGYLRALFAKRVFAGHLRDFALSTLEDAVWAYSEGEGRAYDVLLSDPIAQRGRDSRSVSLWSELRRLNRAFYEDRMAFLREQYHIINPQVPRDGVSEDEESYAMRMFISDSLRPPGLEHLNTPGPLYALREDQSTWVPQQVPAGHREGFQGGQSQPAAAVDNEVYPYGQEDAPWSGGDPNRTPEQAMAEYWGDNKTVSQTMTGAPETMGQAYGDQYAWGDSWQENGGTRFMRYESVPFWQKGGREGIDYDIEENLGTSARELDNHVRRWDMDAVRDPRGQDTRRYGPRTGHVV